MIGYTQTNKREFTEAGGLHNPRYMRTVERGHYTYWRKWHGKWGATPQSSGEETAQ